MTKTVIFIVIMLILLVVIGIFIFNKSGKSVSVFSDEAQKSSYQNTLNNNKSSQISDEEANKIDGSSEFSTDENTINENGTVENNPESVQENTPENTQENIPEQTPEQTDNLETNPEVINENPEV